MKNKELAKIFFEMALLLEITEEKFRPRAYERAAHTLDSLEDDIGHIYKEGGTDALENLSHIGKGIAEKIEEYLTSGHIKEYEALKKKLPVDIAELTAVEGVGPKSVKTLYKKLGIKNIADLEEAAQNNKIRTLPGMGEKTEQKILKGITFLKQSQGRMPIGDALPLAREIISRLYRISGVDTIEVAGSLRRWKETVGDLDFLIIATDVKAVMEYVTSMPEVVHVYSAGSTKTSVRLRGNIDADIRILPKESFGAALQYFTGSKDHNVALRSIAVKKKLKLNEYGLFRGKKRIAGRTEEEIYNALGLSWMPPEMRTNTGEIAAAQSNTLPRLITLSDLRGDLQIQTDWTDGADSIEAMTKEAKSIGHEYIAITDHTQSLTMAHGSDEKKLLRQMKEIDKINKKISGITILKGAEINITKDGTLDIEDSVLAKLDVAGAAVHSHFNLSKKEQTNRVIRAMENPHVDIIFHPTSRVIMKREEITLDFDALCKAAKKTGTILEINAHPWRLDLHDSMIRQAKEYGIRFVVSTDAHAVSDMHYLEYGIGQARRGWAEKKDVINAWPLTKMRSFLKTSA